MTNFEKIVPFLVGALLIATAVLGWLCVRVERRLADRKRINLANYKAKSHLFYILNDIPVTVISAAVAALSLALMIACLADRVVILYAIVLGMLLLVNGAVVYLSVTRKKCGRDIRLFDSYYVQVENVLARKDRTLADIRVCQSRVNELREKLTMTLRGFNQNLAEGLDGSFVREQFAKVDRMVDDYIKEIHRFSAEVESNFDAALREFLFNETVPEFHSVPLRHFDENEVDDLLGAIKSSYGDRIAEMVVEQVNRGAVKSAKALGNIMSLLHKLEVQLDKDTLARFLHAASRFPDRAELAALLYGNRQISAAMVREIFIPQEWDWIFTPVMVGAYNRKELTAILTDMLAAGRQGMCHRLLSGFDGTYLDVLDAALAAERERVTGEQGKALTAEQENSAYRMAGAYRLILASSYAVGNSGNMFENLGYMLYDHREELGLAPDVQDRIARIVRTKGFYQARREIADFYNGAIAYGEPMVSSATRVLLLYIISGEKKFLDAERLAALLCEYRVTLSFGDIATMRALLCAWMLLKSGDAAVINSVLSEIGKLPYGGLAQGVYAPEQATDVARAILAYLTQNDRVRLRSVVYRTESERMMLDRILQL